MQDERKQGVMNRKFECRVEILNNYLKIIKKYHNGKNNYFKDTRKGRKKNVKINWLECRVKFGKKKLSDEKSELSAFHSRHFKM